MLKYFYLFLIFGSVLSLNAQNGTLKTYFASGKVASRLSFINDVLEGNSFWYYENGNIKNEKVYSDGKLNGISRSFFKSGLLEEEQHFNRGMLDGISRSYYNNGSLKEYRIYDEGQLLKISKLDYDSSYIAPLAAYSAGKQKKNIENNDFICPLEICPEPVGGIEEIESKIIYPELAIQYNLEGSVMLSAFINKRGKAQEIKVIKGLGLGCDEAAINAVRNTSFVPGRNNGDEIETIVTFKIYFRIPEKTELPETITNSTQIDELPKDSSSTEVNKKIFISCDTGICPKPIGGIVELLKKLRYPPHAKRNNITGDVVIKAKIDEIGFVVGTEVIKGLGYGCDEAAKSAVLRTQFEPAKNNDLDSESIIEIAVPFMLD